MKRRKFCLCFFAQSTFITSKQTITKKKDNRELKHSGGRNGQLVGVGRQKFIEHWYCAAILHPDKVSYQVLIDKLPPKSIKFCICFLA